MTTAPITFDRQARRVALVEEHVRLENAHDLDGVIATFGDSARYDDEPWNTHYEGRDQVRSFYAQLMAALPDLSIEIVRRHIAAETIVLEVSSAAHRWQAGADCRLPADASRSRFAASIPSTPMTGLRASVSTTIAPPFCNSLAFSTIRNRRWEG